MLITIDKQSWEWGLLDGADGKPYDLGPATFLGPLKVDCYSYSSGYIEGEAFRDGYKVSLGIAEDIMRLRQAYKANAVD